MGRRITVKEVQVIEVFSNGTSVYPDTFQIPFKEMRKHGFKRVKDKRTGNYFWIFNIDNTANELTYDE